VSLLFAHLRIANALRCEASFHPIQEWSETDWMCAIAGEVGEAANKIKKRKRGERIDVDEVADELADAVIYIDLLASRMGFHLEEAVVRKFNEVSRRVGSDMALTVKFQGGTNT